MGHNIIRMPKTDESLRETLTELGPFIDAMYTGKTEAKHGDFNFQIAHWLYLWDSKSGFFVVDRDDKGDLVSVAMVTKFRDMWSSVSRLDIVGMSIVDSEHNGDKEIGKLAKYLTDNQSLLEFEELYYVQKLADGDEYKELLWRLTP